MTGLAEKTQCGFAIARRDNFKTFVCQHILSDLKDGEIVVYNKNTRSQVVDTNH